MRGRLIAVYGGKGCGKTVTAANLAVRLAQHGSTLLISTELTAPTLQVLFAVNVPPSAGLARAVTDGVLAGAVPSGVDGLSLLSVHDDTLALELDYLTVEHAKTLLNSVLREYDYVIVDCESGIANPLSITAVSASDRCYALYRSDNFSRAAAIAYRPLLEGLRKDRHLAYVRLSGETVLSDTDFEAFTGVKFAHKIPHVSDMDAARHDGRIAPKSRQYSVSIDKLALEVSRDERENGA